MEQRFAVLLEARARELLEVASRKAKRKRSPRSPQGSGGPYESAVSHLVQTRSQCDLDAVRAKPSFRMVEARNRCWYIPLG